MNYKFIYFDLDDTLLDHRSAEAAALKDMHERFDLFRSTSLDYLVEIYRGINSDLWKEYGKGFIDRETLQRRRFEYTLDKLRRETSHYEEIGTYYMNAYRDHWKWVEGAKEAFRAIAGRYEVGILTNGFAETQREKIKRFSLDSTASRLVISEETGFLKPQPEIFEHATAQTDCDRDEILYVGDSYTSDVLGGSIYGWDVAWFTAGVPEDEPKRRDAYFAFDNFSRLTEMLDL